MNVLHRHHYFKRTTKRVSAVYSVMLEKVIVHYFQISLNIFLEIFGKYFYWSHVLTSLISAGGPK